MKKLYEQLKTFLLPEGMWGWWPENYASFYKTNGKKSVPDIIEHKMNSGREVIVKRKYYFTDRTSPRNLELEKIKIKCGKGRWITYSSKIEEHKRIISVAKERANDLTGYVSSSTHLDYLEGKLK